MILDFRCAFPVVPAAFEMRQNIHGAPTILEDPQCRDSFKLFRVALAARLCCFAPQWCKLPSSIVQVCNFGCRPMIKKKRKKSCNDDGSINSTV